MVNILKLDYVKIDQTKQQQLFKYTIYKDYFGIFSILHAYPMVGWAALLAIRKFSPVLYINDTNW